MCKLERSLLAVEGRKGASCCSYNFFLPPTDPDADDQEDTQAGI